MKQIITSKQIYFGVIVSLEPLPLEYGSECISYGGIMVSSMSSAFTISRGENLTAKEKLEGEESQKTIPIYLTPTFVIHGTQSMEVRIRIAIFWTQVVCEKSRLVPGHIRGISY